jgi:hypothetical protein
MCILLSVLLHKGAETRDGPAHDERVHFARAFVGVNGLCIGHEAPHLVLLAESRTKSIEIAIGLREGLLCRNTDDLSSSSTVL